MINLGVLKGALAEDASSKAIVRSFFTGKENLTKIQAIKKISPESFGALKEEFINQSLIEYSSRSSPTGIKSTQFLDALNKKYGDEFLKEVFDGSKGPGIEEVKHILNVTERIEKTFKKTDIDKMGGAEKKALMDSFVGLVANIKFKAVNGVSALIRGRMPRDHALRQIITKEGIDKYVASYPGKIDKKTVLRQMNDMIAEWKFYDKLEAAGEVGKRATKQELRRDAEQSTND
jgi:hypothetical protein